MPVDVISFAYLIDFDNEARPIFHVLLNKKSRFSYQYLSEDLPSYQVGIIIDVRVCLRLTCMTFVADEIIRHFDS